MAFEGEPDPAADIEHSLVEASEAGMDGDDLRVLSVLTTWLGVHHGHVHADRLVRRVLTGSPRVRAFWSAVASSLGDRRFARLNRLYEGEVIDLLRVGTEFQISRRGEDARFAGTAVRIPAGTLRDRSSDVVAPADLVRRHPGYKNRVLMGSSWRADVWTVLERDPSLTPASAARLVGCAFATAWQVAQDFSLLRQLGKADDSREIFPTAESGESRLVRGAP
jgi:hypothetical protein